MWFKTTIETLNNNQQLNNITYAYKYVYKRTLKYGIPITQS